MYDATNQISQTTVRNVVGRFSLDQLLSQTGDINTQIKDVIDAHTEPWGAEVTAVEIKDITLPDNMQRAMAKDLEQRYTEWEQFSLDLAQVFRGEIAVAAAAGAQTTPYAAALDEGGQETAAPAPESAESQAA